MEAKGAASGFSGDLDSHLRVFLLAIRVGKHPAQAELFLRSGLSTGEVFGELERKIKE
jgi:hypothetical protein